MTDIRTLEQLATDHQHLVRTITDTLVAAHAGTFGRETVERLVIDSLDRLLVTAKITTFLPVLTERFARDRLRALARVENLDASTVPSVLFVCVRNEGRSQMAAGWFRYLAGDRALVYSGGSAPGSEMNSDVELAMRESGVDISAEFPKPWTDEVVRAADIVVTMGCGDACPLYPGKRYEDWELDDPAGASLDDVRTIRDDIRNRVEHLMTSLGIVPMRH